MCRGEEKEHFSHSQGEGQGVSAAAQRGAEGDTRGAAGGKVRRKQELQLRGTAQGTLRDAYRGVWNREGAGRAEGGTGKLTGRGAGPPAVWLGKGEASAVYGQGLQNFYSGCLGRRGAAAAARRSVHQHGCCVLGLWRGGAAGGGRLEVRAGHTREDEHRALPLCIVLRVRVLLVVGAPDGAQLLRRLRHAAGRRGGVNGGARVRTGQRV